MPSRAESRQRIYAVVARIPRGRVATYGQVARLAGLAGQARQVGYALAALDGGSRIPWQRVVNAQGRVSPRKDGGPAAAVQRLALERERVRFDRSGRIALAVFRWRPRAVTRRSRSSSSSVDRRPRTAKAEALRGRAERMVGA